MLSGGNYTCLSAMGTRIDSIFPVLMDVVFKVDDLVENLSADWTIIGCL